MKLIDIKKLKDQFTFYLRKISKREKAAVQIIEDDFWQVPAPKVSDKILQDIMNVERDDS